VCISAYTYISQYKELMATLLLVKYTKLKSGLKVEREEVKDM
jgi:hypothetical protein